MKITYDFNIVSKYVRGWESLEVDNLNSDQINTFISVGGAIIATVVGALLGWGLEKLSQRGSLKVYPSPCKYEMYNNNKGLKILVSDISIATHIVFIFDVDIYNSSNSTKIMRDIKLTWSNTSNKKKHQAIIDDLLTRKDNGSGTPSYKELKYVNLLPKSIENYRLKSEIELEKTGSNPKTIEEIKLSFTYINDKNKNKSIEFKDKMINLKM